MNPRSIEEANMIIGQIQERPELYLEQVVHDDSTKRREHVMPEITLIKVAEQIISHADSDMSQLEKDRFELDIDIVKSAIKYAEKNLKRNFAKPIGKK